MDIIGLISSLDIQIILVFLAACLLTVWLIDLRHSRSMPPGPFQWPVIGCLPQMALWALPDTLSYLKKLSKKYDGMFSLKLGSFHAVFISDFKILKDAFIKQSDCFSNRPQNMELRRALAVNGKSVGRILVIYNKNLNNGK